MDLCDAHSRVEYAHDGNGKYVQDATAEELESPGVCASTSTVRGNQGQQRKLRKSPPSIFGAGSPSRVLEDGCLASRAIRLIVSEASAYLVGASHTPPFQMGNCASARSLPSISPEPEGKTPFAMSCPPSSILLPLYIYPLRRAWDRLYTAIDTHPSLEFTIIINPNSGPGSSALPDEDYSREIARLNQYRNVTLVGYVRVDWCKRDLEKVCAEVDRYAAWGRHGRGELAMQGIFFDEAPSQYKAERKLFMDAADSKVKCAAGIMGRRLTIHNPGTVPDPEFANPGPDLTTIFETSYKDYKDDEVQLRISNLLRYDRDRCSYMVLSVPQSDVDVLVPELRRRAKYVFLTESRRGWYEKFGDGWERFVEAMARDA
ncbi:cell surface spherulin 4-like protein [Marssonina coronariae]|uniref:Cell surface spherulin 4-like protein n=1 Tax=Diplocarpon coronariae TaxID=2795749 RepID=A0A218Z795_9HELO|nr:cell surface spherulin 4-like protein [Marssonina coronariae]